MGGGCWGDCVVGGGCWGDDVVGEGMLQNQLTFSDLTCGFSPLPSLQSSLSPISTQFTCTCVPLPPLP